jgi:hypothetical protein
LRGVHLIPNSGNYADILLEPEHKALLIKLVEYYEALPAEQRHSFTSATTGGNDREDHFIFGPGQNKSFDVPRSYVRPLAAEGLIETRPRSADSNWFDITPKGFSYYRWLIQQVQGNTAHQHGSATSQTNSGQQVGINQGTMNQYNYNYYGTPPPTDAPPELPTDAPLNPFGRRGRIDDPAEFFGREELLRRIFEDLGKGSNLSLIGERQIGKSSLLCMIQHYGTERLVLPLQAFVYIDMQLVRNEGQLFRAICGKLGIPPCDNGFDLSLALEGTRTILCLDEIEKMKHASFSADVRDELRGLADGARPPLTLVVASSLPLAELSPDTHSGTSPLANICSPLKIPPFSRDEARAFLKKRLQDTRVQFTEDEIADLLEQSQRHPERLQQAAAELFRARTNQRSR